MYTDPSGELLWFVPLIYAAVNLGVDMAMNNGKMNFGQIAMSLGQGALSGALGGATSVGGAFLGAGIGQLNRFMPAIPLYQSAGFNLSISPFIGFGSSGFAGGVNLNASGQIGDFAYSASVGVGFNSGTSSLGESSGGSGFWNAGGFAGYNDGHANYGLGYSYNSFGGKTGQGVGAVTIQAGDFGFRLDEDAFIGDNGDRSRTGGMLMTYKVDGNLTLAFGASMMTGEADGDDDHSKGNPNFYPKGHPQEGKMVGTHRGETNPNLRAGTMYGGVIYKGQASFYGHNSEKRLHSVQNWIHKNVVHYTPYFADRGFSSKPYSYSGSYHSSYLYY